MLQLERRDFYFESNPLERDCTSRAACRCAMQVQDIHESIVSVEIKLLGDTNARKKAVPITTCHAASTNLVSSLEESSHP